MPLSWSDLRAMAAAASTIPERVSSQFFSGDGQMSEKLLQARLDAWSQVSAEGDGQRFLERLSWDGLDLARAQLLLSPGDWSELVPLPAWTTTLQEGLHLLESMPDDNVIVEKEPWPFLDANKPLPFEELLAPFVSLAQRRFIEQSGAAAELLANTAYLTLQRHLLQVLTSLSVPTLHTEFTRIHTQAQTTTTATEGSTQRDEQHLSQHFLQQMRRGGLAALLRTYSVLARLLATTCDLWVEANVELVQRLAADWSAIAQRFASGSELGQVIELQPALSDVHAGRRSVMALTFASGSKLIYKPRSVGMEEAYYHLLHWCNMQDATPPFQILTILNRSTYGWVEYVAQEPCPDQDALRRYYQRAGMLLCLVYVLGGVDCFYDQIIAHGEQPVLVDVSHLLHPYPSPHPQQLRGEDWEQERYSVLHTGLLASWSTPPSRNVVNDTSGLGLSQGYNEAVLDARQTPLPQQYQTLKYGSLKPRAPLHVATSLDASGSLQEEDLHEELCRGFQHLYQVLLQKRKALLAPESPLQALKTQQVRFAYRDRSVYGGLFPKLLAPQALRDAVTRSMLLEPLGSDNVPIEWYRGGRRDRAHWWSVFAAEREALLQGDIPMISARAESDALLIAPDQEVTSCLCQPPFDLLLKRLERLSEEDLAQQRALLQQALPRRIMSMATSREAKEQCGTADEQPDANAFVTQAMTIADSIARHAVKLGHDSVIWVNATFSQRAQLYQLQPMSYSFSDGISGIAFFLAALARRTKIASYHRLASAAVRPLHRLLRTDGERLVREMGLGAGPGLGSVVYALTRTSQMLDEPELLADARAAASLITPERIADDLLLDVHLGVAGALLGLLALYEALPEQEILDRAMWCGQHLLRARTPSKAGCRAWPTLSGEHTTGFAHGTAGIVYALLRLYAVTGDTDLFESAQEGLRYEDRALVRAKGNWTETVGEGKSDFGISWCHGAPGIGLARIGGLPMLATESILQDIEIALQTTQQIGSMGPDHLCCGTSGRAEFLLTAARRLARPELAGMSARWMEQVLIRAEQREALFLNPLLPMWVAHPQLFQGSSGIGYTLLRLAQPNALPSPLLWE
jgi:type 2 lantibiotic biosynthesis protein LanM